MPIRTVIHGTFDVAVARSQLRKMAETGGWRTTLRARSAAALTSLSEALFFRAPVQADELIIDIDCWEEDRRVGAMLQCRIPADPHLRKQVELTRGLLERASNEFRYQMDARYDTVTLLVWDER